MGRFLGNTFDTATARTDPGRATRTRSDTVIADNLRHSATRRHASRSPTRATRDTTTHQEAHKSTYVLLATNAHNGSQGCTANPDKTTGATRVTHNQASSHGMRLSHARRGQAVRQMNNVTGSAKPACTCNMQHATYGRGGQISTGRNVHAAEPPVPPPSIPN